MTNKQAKYLALSIGSSIAMPALLAIATFGSGFGAVVASFLCGIELICMLLGFDTWSKLSNSEDKL